MSMELAMSGEDGGLTYSDQPSIGLVVGTFAAVPYVRLHLEAWRRYYPGIPILIADDGSPCREAIKEICASYGVVFESNYDRLRRTVGDMSAYVKGFDWAASIGVQLLVKMSRRFIPLYNWVPELQALALMSQMPTFSQCCDHFHFGFRTECIAFHCASWRQSGAYQQIKDKVDRNQPEFVEGFLHQLTRTVASKCCCSSAQEYIRRNPRPSDRDGYAEWNIMANKRTTRVPRVLWHDSDKPFDYCRVAALLGLDFALTDFDDPNQGYGLGPP
jgi:hypothetical protein